MSLLANLVKFTQSLSPCVKHSLAVSTVRGYADNARKTAKRNKRERDDRDFSWMEPMKEYQAEKRAQEAAGENEPHLLHVVWRTKPLTGRPWWEKQIMEKFGLDDPFNTYPVVLKNIPSVNKRLMEVKHLVSIKPLTFPHGFPDNPEDYEHSYIKHNGEYIITKKVGQSTLTENSERLAKDPKAKWRLTRETVIKDCMRRRDEYRLLEEYHRPEYHYTMNQDGKEWRYNLDDPTKIRRSLKNQE